jgi:multidrug efflux system membrane fusion protein
MPHEAVESPKRTDGSARTTGPEAFARKTHGGLSWAWILLIVAVILAAAVGWYAWHKYSASQASAQPKGPPNIPVVVATARSGDMPVYLNGLGSVTPLATVTIHTRVDGQLNSVNYVEGQEVHQGDLLAQIDPRPFQVQLEQAQGQLARDQAALQDAQHLLERDKLAGDAIPKQTVDTQQATVDQDAAAIKIDQSAIDNAQLQLTYCRVTSPLTGRIGLRLVDAGNIVHASDANGLAVITELKPVAVLFSLTEDDLQSVMEKPNRGDGLTVEAWDRNFTTKLATGTLHAVDNQVNSSTGTVSFKAIFPNEKETLFPNQFVNARLLVDTIHNAVIVPTPAIQRGPDSTYVYVVKGEKGDQTVESRNVTPGVSEGENTVVTSGLAADEVVVTDGVDKLTGGAKVVVRQSSTTKPSTTMPSAQRTSESAR